MAQSAFQLQAISDARVNILAHGAACAYRAAVPGNVDGQAVVMVDNGANGFAPLPGRAGRALNADTHRHAPLTLVMPIFGDDETETPAGSGVGSKGGVKQPKPGDVVTVPGWMVNRPAEATVSVLIGDKPRLVSGVQWHAPVSL